MKMKTLRQLLMIIGMIMLSCIPAFFINAASSNPTSLTSPIEEATTLLSKAAYGGSVRKSFPGIRSFAATAKPRSIVNGNFDYPYYSGSGLWMRNCNDSAGCLINTIDPNNGLTWLNDIWKSGVRGFDSSKFGWKSTQTGKRGLAGVITSEDRPEAVELQKDYYTGNMYAEIVPYEPNAAIYEDISTTPGAVYHWSIQHGSQSTIQNGDCTQVIIGGTAQQAKRTVSNGHGDRVGNVGTNVCTIVTNKSVNGRSITSRDHNGQWETYEGDYMVPAWQNTTRFSFKSLLPGENAQGNIIDNIKFDITYPLRYHINGGSCTNGGAESTCMPFTGKDGNFYHNYYTSGTSAPLAGNSGSQDDHWDSRTIKRDGYVFAGWSTSPSGPTSFNGNIITRYTVRAPRGDVYAVWIPLTHISWQKVDKVTGNHVGGATFTVTTKETGAKTTVVDNGTGDSDPRAGYITYNQTVKSYGHYVVQETSPPSGYFNDSDSATIYADGPSPAAAVLKDTPKITPTIRKYIESKDNGYVLTLNFTGKQIVGTGGNVSMTNTVVKDTLTKWVDPVDLQSNGTGATISAVDTTGKTVSPPKGTSVRYDAGSKTMTWNMGNFVPINGYTYSISFKIKSTEALRSDATARQSLTDDTKYGPDTGDATTGDISAGKHGWYTNTQATLTYNAKYSTGEQSNNKWDLTNVSGISTTKTDSSTLPNGTYSINASADSSYGFDVPGWDSCSSTSACNINIAKGYSSAGNTASLDQFWTFINNGDYYTIMNGMGGCLDVRGASFSDGTQIDQYTCNGTIAQRWNVVDSDHDGTYMLIPNANASYAVSIYSGTPSRDTPVKLKAANKNDESQRFMLSPVKSTLNIDTSKTYDISSNAASQFNFDSPGVDTCSGQCNVNLAGNDYAQGRNGLDQGYRFIPQTNGGYVLKNGMGACLDATWGSLSDGTQIQQYTCNGSQAQIWDIIESDNRGAYLIVPFYNRSVAISVYSGTAAVGQPLKLKKTDISSSTEQWILSPRNDNTVSMSTPYVIRMAMNPGAVLDVPGLDDCTGNQCNVASAGNDYRRGSNGYDQTWTFTKNSYGSYTITNAMNQCLDVYGASFADGARIDAYPCNGTLAQRWVIKYLNHSFMLVSSGNGNFAMSVYSGTYTGGQYMKLKKYSTTYLSERFNVNPLSDLNLSVNISNESNGSYNIGTSSDGSIKMSTATDRSTAIRMLNWLGNNGNSIYMLEMGSSYRCIKETSTNMGSSISTGTCSTTDSSMAWQSVYYDGQWMFRNMASGYFMKANQNPVINGTTLSIDGLLGQVYTNMGTLIYKKPIVPGYRWWYKGSHETTTIHLYDAGSDNKDRTQKVFSCAAYINESVQGTDGYTKSVSGTTQTTATDIAKLKNSSLTGAEFTTWYSLGHSLNSPETQEKYNKIVAELQSACDSSNKQTTAASTTSTTPTLSGDMQKAYSQGGTLLITRSKQNTTVSAPSKSMTYSVRPVDYIYEHYSRKLSIGSPGNDWHLEGNFQCGNGYTSGNNSDANNLYCDKVVVGNWQTNDDVSSIKASYNKQGQSFKGTGSDASYKWDTGTRKFRGYYCATNGAWKSWGVDASSYLNGCGTTSNELAPSYDLNRTNIHLYHYMMLNMLCDKTDFTSYYNKVKNYVMKNDSTYQGSGLSSSWQGSLISKPSSNANVVQFPRVTALLSGIVRQNSDATITNLGTTGVTATTLANNLRAIGVNASSTSSNTTMMNNYLTAYTASKDPVYTKECPYSCVADRTLTGTGSISSDGREYSTDRTGFYNRASDGKGAIIGNMNEADAFSSIFYRNNAWNQVAMSVLRPISSNGLTYNGSAAKTTTVLKNTTGTPWNTALSLSSIAPNSSNTSMFYSNDTIGNFMSPTAQSIYEAPNNGTVSGEQNIFKIRAAWASDSNNPLKFDVSWEFDAQNSVNVPTTAGFGANGALAASNIKENIVNATSDGRCWYISKVSGYPSDTTSIAHDYSGYGSNVFSNADNPIFSGFKSGFNVTFIRSSSE